MRTFKVGDLVSLRPSTLVSGSVWASRIGCVIEIEPNFYARAATSGYSGPAARICVYWGEICDFTREPESALKLLEEAYAA